MDNQSLRLNKFLAERLGVSRREADELISVGKITVNGEKAVLGVRIDKKSKVCYNNKIVPFDTEFSYFAFNKPVGYVCSRRAQGQAPTIYTLLPEKFQKLKTVGRLDKDSSGLILLTNDGDFAFQMTHPKFRKTKTYQVELDKPLEPLHRQMISDFGVMLDDGPSRFKIIKDVFPEANKTSFEGDPEPGKARSSATTPVSTGVVDAPRKRSFLAKAKNAYTVILTEGRNRQIRRTFAALGYKVTKLHRISFGKYELNDLKPGKYVIIEP
ncbi:rRNA pseudouridine synthase [Candidatus Saccharibacteria bacterium]|nr:rRNA pseudouridine synthase [Candidatus Saccharibacteria bacterium]